MKKGHYTYSLVHGVHVRPSRLWVLTRSTYKTSLIALAAIILVTSNLISNPFIKYKNTGSTTVPGESYEICSDTSYLTSPYTYSALASGTASYTVAQYEALSGYGTTLPSLPSYISSESSSTEAAEIIAPGTEVDNLNPPEGPVLYFFEGGSYGKLSVSANNGDEFIGGSHGSYGEPNFNNNGSTEGGGIAASSGTSPASTLATVAGSSALAVGTTSFALTSSRLPIVPGEVLDINGVFYPVQSVSGSQSSYTITLQSNTPIAQSTAAGTSVSYLPEFAGGVTVQYLSIEDDLQNPGTITSGAQWTIENNKIYNGVAAGENSEGTAIYDAGDDALTSASFNIESNGAHFEGGTIEYNCLENEGHSGIHEFGRDSTFAYNEVDDTASNTSETNGSTGDAGDKWWATLNSNITDNYFNMDGDGDTGDPIWFDNGNTGFLVEGNYFYGSYGGSIDMETAFNGDITNNMIVDGGWGATNSNGNPSADGAIEVNQTGAWNIPGSNYNDELLINNNTLTDDWENITIWDSGSRSCQNPQEQSGTGDWDNSNYCTGGYPNGDGDFSVYNYDENDGPGEPNGPPDWGTLTTAASSGATTLYVNNSYAPTVATGDYIGFTSPGQSGYPSTTSSSTASVTSFTGTQSLTVASTTGFPSSGNIQTATSTANAEGTVVGATFSYSGVSGNTLENVSLLNPSLYVSSTDLVSGGYVMAFEPYKITAVNSNSYNPYTQITISPGLSSNEAAGANIFDDGSCYDDFTSAATPTSPLAPDGQSYFDGCMWESRNVTISDNTENFTVSDITGGTNLWGSTAYQSCASDSSNGGCGTNFEEYQPGYYPGGTGAGSYETYQNEMEDAFLANPNFETPITAHWFGAPSGNDGESAWDITWSGNTYNGPVYFYTGTYGTCNLPSQWSCFVNTTAWESTSSGGWANDDMSTTPPSTPTNVSATANSSTSVTVSWNASTDSGGPGLGGYYILRGGTQVGSVNASTTSYTNTGLSPNTQYSYTVEAYDTDGPPNVSAASSASTVTTPSSGSSPPTVTITSPTTQTSIHGTAAAVDATATPQGGATITQCQLIINGTIVQTLTSAPYNFTFSTTGYTDGSYALDVKATDSNANTTTTPVTVQVTNGDFGGTGQVGLADLIILGEHYNQTGTFTYAQGNITGATTSPEVGLADLVILGRNYGYNDGLGH